MKFDKKYISAHFSLIIILALVFSGGIVSCMVKTMTVDKDMWVEIREKNFEQDSIIVKPQRGNILSCDGQLMASSIPDYKVYIDFKSGLTSDAVQRGPEHFTKMDSIVYFTKDSLFNAIGEKYAEQNREICEGLSRLCPKFTAEQYKQHLASGWKDQKRYFEICKGTTLNYIQFQDFITLPFFRDYKTRKYFVGLNIEERNNRKKPFGSLARRTLGEMYGAKDSARSGLELAFDTLLRGVPGIKHRRKILNKYVDLIDVKPKNGYDIVTTIDVTLQDICETALRDMLRTVDAAWGVVILMETKTGDVKSIVNLSRYDDGNFYEDRPFAMSAMMEPGSTFKTASILVGVDDGVLSLNDHVDGNGGVFPMYGAKMKDHNWHRGGYHDMDLAHTLMYSSNIGVSRLIDAHYHNTPEKFVEGLHRIGIGMDLQLPFEEYMAPRIRMPKPDRSNWSKTALPWMSIGYETQIPPISTVTFYNAIANGGKMVKPRFVKAVQEDGVVIEEMPVEVLKEQIAKPSSIKTIRDILIRVVNEQGGVGKPAKSKHFLIAGKTGTAQISGVGGYSKAHLVSFCGFFPAEDPKYTGIVAINISSGPASGGTHAGTTFKKIAESIYANDVTTDLGRVRDSLSVFVPEVMDGDIDAAGAVLTRLSLPWRRNTGKGQLGKADCDGKQVRFAANESDYEHLPDLTGMGLRDAVYEIESRGMTARPKGMGRVVSQSLAAGSKTRTNEVVEIELERM